MTRFLWLPAALVLAACGSLVPSTVAGLMGVSPLEADPADFAVSVDLPEGVTVAPAGVTLSLKASAADGESAGIGVRLAEERQGGTTLYSVAPEDLTAFRDVQGLIRAWEAADSDGTTGSLTVEVTACTLGDGPEDGATFDVGLRSTPDGPFRPLIRRAPVADILNAAGVDAAPCPDL
ncbi:hypothetical protein GQ651_16340 [Alphaproteobacteria bacterium GH1-50]|uniref:Lipoprotein n=1 Tax=Kangsaoukella pontilimi TaxID=2691042 RepID=A0A7C9MSL9_9RHOB|nr:hypothetical protein [Kangsaoukella pontilimi]MXQ09417.1 hypothetical protein [Kangsaoukella pontilimi]